MADFQAYPISLDLKYCFSTILAFVLFYAVLIVHLKNLKNLNVTTDITFIWVAMVGVNLVTGSLQV